jgi:hypothetical protein
MCDDSSPNEVSDGEEPGTELPRRAASSRRVPRLLAGIGLLGALTCLGEVLARNWPELTGALIGVLLLVGNVWLAVLVLRTCERSSDPSALAPIDRQLVFWSGPLSLLLMAVAPIVAFANIEQRQGTNYFTSSWSFELVELLMSMGFVLSLCCVLARPQAHVPPRLLWKILCVPLALIFGAYALLMPISCAAERLRP